MDTNEKLAVIKDYYSKIDDAARIDGKKLYHDTGKGIWGPSDIDVCYAVFRLIHLEKMKGLCDLGSGDGRISLTAALFTRSTGIEYDQPLFEESMHHKDSLSKISEVARCNFTNTDYTSMEFSDYDVIFIFADHAWTSDFESRMLAQWKGVILSYSNIFAPKKIPKGKTYWCNQTPVVSYLVNVDDSFVS